MTTAHEPARAPSLEISAIVAELRNARTDWRVAQGRSLEPRGRDLPSRGVLLGLMADLHGLLFPMRLGPPDLRQDAEDFYVGSTLDKVLHTLGDSLCELVGMDAMTFQPAAGAHGEG